jgi:tRNA (guanine37-N1)-methyltransferase
MHIDIISVVPNLLESFFSHSILKRAQAAGLAQVQLINLRDYSTKKHQQVDDYQFGGGAGMVLSIEPIAACIRHLQTQRVYDEIVYTSPDGQHLDQKMANTLSLKQNLIIICGHYKGIDHRVRDLFVTKEISLGDFVLSGGEIAAAAIADAVIRLLPGVLNDETSALTDSFQDNLLSAPVYTRPAVWEGHAVPDILLSGHEAKIEAWRHNQALARTSQLRPALLQSTN